ncbi:hypothetical protein [Bdellovibrio sp. NC01]|uniref:hypothetical protein n=1 Tax=Bdellovibrio sp. NC01 TaxID=2220073 RepID=UPI00115B6880|nr:hypothetical protein [Bdellovibrio sp. NC01]QDK37832.1 hypothetical protein DOE51_09655 [Bdellovibrio sp. NC01]
MKMLAAFLFVNLLALPGFALERVNVYPNHEIGYLSLEFGEVPVGQTVMLEVGINAPANKDLNINSITIAGETYQAETNCGDTVSAGKFCVIDVYFTPTSVDEFYGELGIKTSEGNLILKLYGYGK